MKNSYKHLLKSAKAIKTITWYAVKMFYRDKAAIFFSLFIPVTIMSVFGILNFEQAIQFNLGIIKKTETELNQNIIKSFDSIEVVNLNVGSYEEEIAALRKGDREMVLILPDTITPNTKNEITIFYNEAQNPTSRQTNLTIVSQVFNSINDSLTNSPKIFELKEEPIETKNLTAIDYVIPGIIAMSLMQMNLFGVIGGIVAWRDKGILKRLLATPVKPSVILFSQVATRLSISLMQSSLLLAIGIFVFGMNLSGSLLLVLLLAILGGIIFLNIGFTISGISNTQNTVVAVANLVMMPQMFLSGVFFQREALPDLVFRITEFLPLTYLTDAMRAVMIEGANLAAINIQLYGLLFWVLATFFLSVKFFRWE